MGAVSGGRPFEQSVAAGLAECGVTNGAHLLVALSGGPDSTALLLALAAIAPRAGLHIAAAHFDHMLRPGESQLDAQFCAGLCESLGVELLSGSSDVRHHASAHGMTIEAAARDLRYRFLANAARQADSQAVLTGHTLDDQAETVLLAMTRGAGLRGIAGMRPVTVRAGSGDTPPLKVLRPLLRARKADTAAYCAARGVTPREDASNADLRYARNRVRHRVMPELAALNPAVAEALARLAENARSSLQILDEAAGRELSASWLKPGRVLDRKRLAALSPEMRSLVLAAAYREAAGTLDDLEQTHIDAMTGLVAGRSGGAVDLPNGVQMIVEYAEVVFAVADDDADSNCPYPKSVPESPLSVPGTLELPGGARFRTSMASPPPQTASLTRWQALLDPALAGQPLAVRPRRDGDRFHPLGMPGEVKLQDFLVNQHVPSRWRDRVPLVTVAGRIVWVAGERVAEWAKAPDGAERALLIEYQLHNFR